MIKNQMKIKSIVISIQVYRALKNLIYNIIKD